MDLLKLIGVAVVIIGFALRFDTMATVVAAGIITGLVAVVNKDMTFIGIFETLGQSFVNQRVATIFAITIGIIGISERYGLKDKAVDLIRKLEKATCGVVISAYMIIRALAAAGSIKLGGHVQFVRPIIFPMAEGAAIAKYDSVDEASREDIKSHAAAADNYGNFFAQNCFMGASGTLLIASTIHEQGFDINPLQVAVASIPIAIIAIIMTIIQNILLDKRLNARNTARKETEK